MAPASVRTRYEEASTCSHTTPLCHWKRKQCGRMLVYDQPGDAPLFPDQARCPVQSFRGLGIPPTGSVGRGMTA